MDQLNKTRARLKGKYDDIGQEWTIRCIQGEWWWLKREYYSPYPLIWIREDTIGSTYVPDDWYAREEQDAVEEQHFQKGVEKLREFFNAYGPLHRMVEE